LRCGAARARLTHARAARARWRRHARYQTQFRAMFVRNCRVNRAERLRAGKPAVRDHVSSALAHA
jgi:hypothetical protein